MNQIDSKVGISEKIGYPLGDVASCIFFQMFMFFLTYFYTDVFGITAAAAGTMMGLTRIWDTVNDPMMGMIADRTKTKWGKFRPYLLWMAIPFGLIGFLTFFTPNFTATGKLVYAYITYTLMMMVYTAINIPYNAMLGVISPVSKERISLSAYKFYGAFTGGLIIQYFTIPLVKHFGQGDEQLGYKYTGAIYAIIATGLFILTFFLTKERVQPPVDQKTSVFTDLKDLAKNRPWLIMFFLGVFTLSSVAIRSAATMYYFKYYVQNENLVKWFLTSGTVAVLVGIFIAERIARIIGKKKLYGILMVLAFVFTILFFFLGPKAILWMFVLNILKELVMGPTSPLVWAMYADTADWSEWKTGRRATGLVFSAATFAQKMGWTVGGAMGGWILALYGYQAGIVQTEMTLRGIRLMMSVFPAIGAISAAVIVLFYRIDEKMMAQIEKELKERRLT